MQTNSLQIELTAPHAITQPTPFQIEVPGSTLPDGNLLLRDESTGTALPAQKNGDIIFSILENLPANEPRRYHAESTALDESEPIPGVTLHEEEDSLELRLPQGLFSAYHFGEGVVRPFLWPVNGPGQVPMTRAYPINEENKDETTDHPHHTSLWSAFDEVNGVNNWHNKGEHGATRHQKLSGLHCGTVCGGFTAHGVWESAQGEPVLDETRTVLLYDAGKELRLLDYTISFTAGYGDATFGDTKEAGVLSVRVATTMDGARGGVITNSEGGKGEDECWGKKAAWCDYTGEADGQTLGVTIFDHPENPNFPTRWHVRNYGLFATNPLSTACFEAGEATPYTIKNGETATFRYRVLLHRGSAADAHVADFYEAWTQPITVKVLS